jgi:hypothetical protein
MCIAGAQPGFGMAKPVIRSKKDPACSIVCVFYPGLNRRFRVLAGADQTMDVSGETPCRLVELGKLANQII